MGRPKKVTIEAEETEPVAGKPATKTVEARHVVTYTEPITVPVTEAETSEEEIDDEPDEEIEPRERVPSLRTRLRNRLAKNGITDAEQLRLRIDRLPLYDSNGQAGINAEKEFLRTLTCTESFFTSDDYLDTLRAIGGAGTYWLTLRHKNNIVASWQERIGGAPQVEQSTIEGIAAAPGGSVDPTAMIDVFWKQFDKFQKFQQAMLPPWMKELNPATMIMPQPNQPNTTEGALMTLLNADDELLNQAVGKLRKVFRGDGAAAEEKGPWDAVVALITSPTLPQTIQMLAQQFRAPQPNQATGNQPPDSPPPMPPDVLAQQRLLAVLTNAMRLNSDVATVLPALDGFAELFPEHRGMIEQFLSAEPQQLLGALPQFFPPAAEVVGLPHAAEWVGKLKAMYFGEAEEASNG